jgi:hypothetical protein
MKPGAAVNQIRELMEAVPPKERDHRWQSRFDDVPRMVDTAQAKFREEPGEPIFDPWDDYIVPKFPLEILPQTVQRFVTEQSRVVGCDPSALAMATLANASGSLDHRFKLKLMRNGDWWVSPRLWVLLVGDPSRKKTPVINTAVAELEVHQNRVLDEYETRLAKYEATLEGWNPKSGERKPDEPRKPPRYVVSDTSTEKLGELLARTDRGILVKRDEFAGWLGSMEKYAGKGSGADRAFWLQTFDGGPFTVDRIARGEIRVGNLSASLIGGIQPQKLTELHGLTSDGLLQRFLPVMMGPSTFPIDAPSSESTEEYRRLTRQMIGAGHATLSLTDDALPVLEDLRRQIHDLEQVASGFAAGFQGFLGKLPGLAGSLALILHLMPDPWEQRLHQVSRQTAADVRRLVLQFILPHAYEFYRTAESVTDGDRLQRIASWIVTAGKERFSARDLIRNVRDLRGASLKDVHLRISPLVAGGWLTPENPGPENRVWIVSPAVKRQFEARCHLEEARKAALARLMGSPRKGEAA